MASRNNKLWLPWHHNIISFIHNHHGTKNNKLYVHYGTTHLSHNIAASVNFLADFHEYIIISIPYVQRVIH